MLQINHKTRRIYDILYFCFCESIMAKTRPTYIVLDTNVLLRLLILDYGTKENIGIPALAQAAEIRITLAPHQEDEFWRNASTVFQEHHNKWKSIVRDSKKRFRN